MNALQLPARRGTFALGWWLIIAGHLHMTTLLPRIVFCLWRVGARVRASSALQVHVVATTGDLWRGANHNLYGYHVLGGGSCVRIINGCDHEWSAGPLAWTFTCDLWRRICGIPGGRWSSGVIGQLIQSNRRKQRLAKVKTYHRYNLSWAKLLHLN